MGADEMISRSEILSLVIRVAALSAISYYTVKWLVDAMDPTKKAKMKAQAKAKKLMSRLGIPPEVGPLNEYELMIASNLVEPGSIMTGWGDIAGLDSVIQEMRDTVILPIQKRDLFVGSQLTQAPKGVLLHGPPGCGKTMIAKATAREAGAHFINLDGSALHDKWYGESQKLAAAVFTLAQKIQPCIVFIDEIDSLLRARDSHDHEATAMIKAQFMQLWDGLATDSSCTVVVMGATNRPKDVDRAILRRMPATFHIGLPNVQQRKCILSQILRIENVDEDVDYNRLSTLTDGFSGSDLRELCRTASVYRVRDYVQLEASASPSASSSLRPIMNEDLLKSLGKMKESKLHCTGPVGVNSFSLD